MTQEQKAFYAGWHAAMRSKADDEQDEPSDVADAPDVAWIDYEKVAESEGSIPRSAPPCRFFVTGEFPHRCAVYGSHEESHANSTAAPALPGSPRPEEPTTDQFAAWLTGHQSQWPSAVRNHTGGWTNRYYECSCGATFWFTKTPVAAGSPRPDPATSRDATVEEGRAAGQRVMTERKALMERLARPDPATDRETP